MVEGRWDCAMSPAGRRFPLGRRGRRGHVAGKGLRFGELCRWGMGSRHHFTEGALPKLCSVEHETFEILQKTALVISLGDITYCTAV